MSKEELLSQRMTEIRELHREASACDSRHLTLFHHSLLELLKAKEQPGFDPIIFLETEKAKQLPSIMEGVHFQQKMRTLMTTTIQEMLE